MNAKNYLERACDSLSDANIYSFFESTKGSDDDETEAFKYDYAVAKVNAGLQVLELSGFDVDSFEVDDVVSIENGNVSFLDFEVDEPLETTLASFEDTIAVPEHRFARKRELLRRKEYLVELSRELRDGFVLKNVLVGDVAESNISKSYLVRIREGNDTFAQIHASWVSKKRLSELFPDALVMSTEELEERTMTALWRAQYELETWRFQ